MASANEFYLPAGNHPIDLADGRIVGPGESFKLTAEEQKDPHNKRYIDEGVFQSLKGGDK